MSVALKTIGALLLCSCLLVGLSVIFNADWSSYESTKEVYEELPTNPFAKEEYMVAKYMFNNQVGLGIATILSGIIGSLFFFSIATIIDYLKEISSKLGKNIKQKTEIQFQPNNLPLIQ